MENEIRFEKGIVGEDNEWYYHVVMAAKSLALVDEPLYIYRRRQGSTTTAITRKNLVDQLHVLDKWEKILQTKATDSRTSVVRSQSCETILQRPDHLCGTEGCVRPVSRTETEVPYAPVQPEQAGNRISPNETASGH